MFVGLREVRLTIISRRVGISCAIELAAVGADGALGRRRKLGKLAARYLILCKREWLGDGDFGGWAIPALPVEFIIRRAHGKLASRKHHHLRAVGAIAKCVGLSGKRLPCRNDSKDTA